MSAQTAALVFAVVFAIVGFAGFFASPPPLDAPPLSMEHGHGMVFGMFPTNTVHNIVHLTFAILGLAAWGSGRARGYFQFLAITYALLAVLGVSAATNTAFGLVPIWGNDVFLHLAVAVAAAYFGFMHSAIGAHMHHGTPHRV
jgi:hypothetical protein